MSAISDAIARLQDIVASCTDVTFKSAPDFPTDNVEPFPCSIAYIGGGNFQFDNATTLSVFPVINLELHFSRVNLKQAHQQIDSIAIELPRRLAGDPTLNAKVDTIIASGDQQLTFEVRPFAWNTTVTSEMLKFSIPVKMLQTPLA